MSDLLASPTVSVMKGFATLTALWLMGLGSFCLADAEQDQFDAKVKAATEQVKKAWPLDKPESREFYKIVSTLKADFEQNNAWLFENATWPLILQRRAEQELKLRRIRKMAGKRTSRSPSSSKSSGALGKAPSLDTDLEMDAMYDRKGGKRRYLRRVGGKK